MNKITKEQIEKVCDDLKKAMIAKLEIDEKAEKIQLEKQKIHKMLLLAQEEVRAIKII